MKKLVRIVAVVAAVFGCISFTSAMPSYFTDTASFNAASSTTLVEDFESIVPKDKALASFVSNGITYTGLPGSNVWVASPGYKNFGVPVTTSSILTSTGPEDFTVAMTFVAPSTALGFDTYLNTYGPATIEVHDAGGLAGVFSHSHAPTTIGFFGVTSPTPITMIRWTTVGGEIQNTGIDNVVLGTVIPAPGALLLGSIGIGLVGYLRRRRAL